MSRSQSHFRVTALTVCMVVASLISVVRGDPSGIVSDDFNTCLLDTSLWQVIDPVGDATFTVTGIATDDATVSLSVPAGIAHTPWGDGNNTARLMQIANDTDLGVEVKFDAPIIGDSQLQGILIEQDESNYLCFDLYSTDTENRIRAAIITSGSTGISEDFESYIAGSDPTDWIDTGPNSSMAEDNSLFYVLDVSSNNAFGTPSEASDIHSHYVGTGSDSWSSYEYTGRMMATNSKAGIGVTFLSDYPNTDSYYRLRSVAGKSFHISPHPWPTASITGGITDSGVKPLTNTWYWFRVQLDDDDVKTTIRAKIWQDGTTEPTNWQIDCYDSSAVRYRTGTVGLWSYNLGSKYWDDLNVFLPNVGSANIIQDAPITAGAPLSMSVVRQNNLWTQTYSYDGVTWLPSTAFEHAMTVTAVGPFVGNADTTPAFTGVIDYFFNQTEPIEPEDGPPIGNPGATLTVNITGNGTVTWEPEQEIYYCDEVVTLNATPDGPGWLFEGWSGDLTGTDPQQAITMTQSYIIDATFVPDDRPLEITDVNVHTSNLDALVTWTTNKPATSSVAYGLADIYELGTVDNGDYVTSHAIVLTGLDINTEYHFQITSVDALGNSLSTDDATFMTPTPGGFASDDFNTCALDTNTWSVVDPRGDAILSVSGIGTNDATLTVSLPEGLTHDVWGDGNNTVRLTQPSTNNDFEIQVKFDTPLLSDGQQQGILIEQDPENFLYFDFHGTNTQPRILAAIIAADTSSIYEDFQGYDAGDDPTDWLDTEAKSSLTEDDTIFKVFDLSGEKVFGTLSTASNVHSHYVGGDSATWSGYEYAGRMMITDANGGIGITFLSDYPNSDSYYRLRRYKGTSFHISPHPDGIVTISDGVTDTGVTPLANIWYLFKVQVEDTGLRMEIRAKVWRQDGTEPASWQVNCYDDHSNRLVAGTVGLWSMGSGAKYWDNLEFGSSNINSAIITQDSPIAASSPLYMTIRRNGDLWTQTYSYDGTNWLPSVTFEHAMTVNTVGPCVGNTGSAPAFTGIIDYFFNGASPIEPEDGIPAGNPGATLTVNVTGNGTVTWDPDQSLYYCDEVVTLTATPEWPGWLFDGWSGDLTGTASVETLSMTESRTVGVTFVPDDRPLEITEVNVGPSSTTAQVTWTTNKPATSHVAYGLTGDYGLGSVGSSEYVTSHSILLTGLDPLTEYHFQISGVDGLGNSTSTPDATFMTDAVGGFLSDDFNTCVLNTEMWQTVNPLDDATFTVSGIGSDDATVAIALPAGTSHTTSSDGNNTARIMQPATNTDFELEVKFDAAMQGDSQMQGVIIEQDADNFLRFDFHSIGTQNRIYAAIVAPGTGGMSEDFESYGVGTHPLNWRDTAANNSMAEDDNLFSVRDINGNNVLGTDSDAADIHCHYVGPDSSTWSSYEYTGKMMATNAGSGLGVTFLSDYPNSDSYYRLRCAANHSFHISPHPWPTASITGGTTDSGVVPVANQWFQFKIQVEDDGTKTLIRAKVWADGTTEPANWQIDCYDSSTIRYTTGTIGTWAYDVGSKYWDDLAVSMLTSGSATTVKQEAIITASTPLYMAISRQGDLWTQQYSYDGVNWLPSVAFEHAMTVTAVGPFVGNEGSAPAFTGVVDYFFNTAAPIVPEDGPPSDNPGTTLTVNVTGNGSVAIDPNQTIYYCDELVTLTATPGPGWLFDSWAGDLSGSDPQQTLTMATSQTVEAIFVTDDRPLEITDINVDVGSISALITWTTNKPATSSVAYGTTDAYDLGSVSHPEYVTSHAIQLTNLTPLTEYHFQITSIDGLGNELNTDDSTFTTPVPGSFLSDDFNACAIDSGLWNIIDPLGDATFATTGTGSSDAVLEIALPGNVIHNPWGAENNAARLMQPASDTDFDIQIKFDTPALSESQIQGLIIEEDADQYLCFDFRRASSQHRILAAAVAPGTGTVSYDFQDNVAGTDPVGWLDTAANNSMTPNDSLFKVYSAGGSMVFGTVSTASDIHSHYIGTGSDTWTSYEYTGRMMITNTSGGIGVTFLSDYPNSDSYYRLRSTGGGAFHISPHPWPTASITGGVTSSGVTPNANQWYRFRVQFGDDGTRTSIKAKVWTDGTNEPANWQIDCYDSSSIRYTAGTVGLWSYNSGSKYWDDLEFGLSDIASATIKQDAVIPDGSPVYMSISRQGDMWTQRCSYDGTNWFPSVTFEHAMTVNAIGPFVGNNDSATDFTGVIDYFFNPAIPIEPEDGPPSGNPGTTLTINITGQGSVAVNPDQPVYYCNELVTVTAVPGGPGWLFDHWSGDLSGSEPEETLTMSASRTIEATFVPDDRPLEITDINAEPSHQSALITWTTNKPATSSVAYGKTDSYELGDVQNGQYVTYHSMQLSNLDMLTEYHFQVTSVDGLGNSLSSADATFTTTVPGSFISDDFNAFNLNRDLWTVIDPLGDATFLMVGTNTPNAQLEITIPGGTAHTISTDGINAPRIMQPAMDTDFGLEVKFESAITLRYQQQGVVIVQDDDTFLRLDFYSTNTDKYLFIGIFDNGTMTVIKNMQISPFSPWHMSINRVGDQWSVSYSFNGTDWALAADFTYSMTVTSLGPFIANDGSPAPAFTGLIDYFFNAEAPIEPEDGTIVQDTTPPFLMDIDTSVNEDTVILTWKTDELADSLVEYGTTTSYEAGSVFDDTLVFDHTIAVTGLQAETVYNFRITSQDASTNASQSDNLVVSTGSLNTGPTVDAWYGTTQEFGHMGMPQPWVNILGNVSDPDGVVSLSYALNGGPQWSLSIGPNDRRLASPGDFNVDLSFDELLPGPNQLHITAIDGIGKQSVTEITVIDSSNAVWPLPCYVDWTTVSNINHVAQVVDGLWNIEDGTVRPAVLDYDRLIGVGDLLWQDYEVTVPITAHQIDPGGYAAPSYGPAVGLLLRWPGHSDDGGQPMQGVYPLGAIGIFRWTTTVENYQIFGNGGGILASGPTSDVLKFGVLYMWKMRVETQSPYVIYKLKVWEASEPEPYEWKLTGKQATWDDPGSGSLLLLAHHVDANFGNVTVTPPPFDDGSPVIFSNIQAVPNDSGALISWTTNIPTTSQIDYGTTTDYELGTVEDSTLMTNHFVQLTGLAPGTLHHYRITSVAHNGIGDRTDDLTFTTTVNCDVDTDEDGVNDCDDDCPTDPYKIEPGLCGCGVADLDSDGDGLLDCGVLDYTNWLDTGAGNSLVPNDSLFSTFNISDNEVFGTTSTLTNIHSHYRGMASTPWSASTYEYTGRLMITDPTAGIGLTFLSDYPNSDSYYRLRRYGNTSFHISPHPDDVVTISSGTIDTSVTPSANVWYRFRIQVEDTALQTNIKAKVWAATGTEPVNWQVNCYDAHSNRLRTGTVGIWSMGAGAKYLDDLQVTMP